MYLDRQIGNEKVKHRLGEEAKSTSKGRKKERRGKEVSHKGGGSHFLHGGEGRCRSQRRKFPPYTGSWEREEKRSPERGGSRQGGGKKRKGPAD